MLSLFSIILIIYMFSKLAYRPQLRVLILLVLLIIFIFLFCFISHFGSEGKKSPRSARPTPVAGSPASSGSSRLSPGDRFPISGSAQGSSSPHAALPSSSSSSSSAARAKSNPSPHTQSPGRTEHRTAGKLTSRLLFNL